jgi:hypothetical protein
MTMLPLKAHVKNGRLVLDEPTDLPEGDVVELVPRGATPPPPEAAARSRLVAPHPDDEADVLEGVAAALRGDALSPQDSRTHVQRLLGVQADEPPRR